MELISTIFSALIDPIIFIPIIMAAIVSADRFIPIAFIAKEVRAALQINRMRMKIMRWQVLIDGKVWIIVFTLLLAYLVTAIAGQLLRSTLAEQSSNVWVSFYASWAVDVVFFTVVGLVVTLMGFRSPVEEDFENRISILYSGKRDPRSVMQYNSAQIKKLSAYAERASRKLLIHEYNENYKAYRVTTTTTYVLKNLFDDVPFDDEATFSLTLSTFESSIPQNIGNILSIWFKEEKLKRPAAITAAGFSTNVPVMIGPGDTEELKFEYIKWIPIGEDNYVTPQHVVELFEMTLVSHCSNGIPVIESRENPEVPAVRKDLVFNQPISLSPVRGVAPGKTIFLFKFREPTKTYPTESAHTQNEEAL